MNKKTSEKIETGNILRQENITDNFVIWVYIPDDGKNILYKPNLSTKSYYSGFYNCLMAVYDLQENLLFAVPEYSSCNALIKLDTSSEKLALIINQQIIKCGIRACLLDHEELYIPSEQKNIRFVNIIKSCF